MVLNKKGKKISSPASIGEHPKLIPQLYRHNVRQPCGKTYSGTDSRSTISRNYGTKKGVNIMPTPINKRLELNSEKYFIRTSPMIVV